MDPTGLLDGVLLTEEAISVRVGELAAQVGSDYLDRELVLVTVLKGGVFFLADLCRRLEMDARLEFMAISQYGPGSHGVVRITKDLDGPVEGLDVLVVEDIIDTGLTLNYLLGNLRVRNPASLAVCVLLDRDVRRIVDLPISYRGFRLPDRFVVGYGLDFRGTLRNLRFIAALKDEVLER